MVHKELTADDVGKPAYPADSEAAGACDIFNLSSHRRAREALEFALSVDDPRFNIFVLGEEQSGRLTNTRQFIEAAAESLSAPDDWVYLNNFSRPADPRPYRLPKGAGRELRDALEALIRQLREALREAINTDEFQARLQAEEQAAQTAVEGRMNALRDQARGRGVDILQTPQGAMIVAIDAEGKPVPPQEMTDEQRQKVEEAGPELSRELASLMRDSTTLRGELQKKADELGKSAADQASAPLFDAFAEQFGKIPGLARWIVELRADVIENFARFLPRQENDTAEPRGRARRYRANLLVDNSDRSHAPVIVEPNPTYENLFGRIEYQQTERTFETDFTMIRAGSLHRANGGVLILRADSVAAAPGSWAFLKAALRDQEIRIEEPHRMGGLPVAGAPKPVPVPLSVRVVLVASPFWYYSVFTGDPEFRNYFKVKADIDRDMEATPENLRCYRSIIRRDVQSTGRDRIEDDAIDYLLGVASRWAADREKVSSQFERVEEVIVEAHRLADDGRPLARQDIIAAIANRRRRNARLEDRVHETLEDGIIHISTEGTAVGQVNGLTVRDTGDHGFGAPSRITARASAGRNGVINIERDTALGGPIQQKGVMVLQGFLTGIFARRYPLSFNCSITFEQSYGGVEGDSASLAELLAIMSDLSGVPLRQDLAITGSVNQRGEAQAIGGAHHKIEGFFRACKSKGDLTGTQGVVIPASNERNLVLRDEVIEAVRNGTFHIYSVKSIDEAVALFTGAEPSAAGADGLFPPESVYGKVAAQLDAFDRALAERAGYGA